MRWDRSICLCIWIPPHYINPFNTRHGSALLQALLEWNRPDLYKDVCEVFTCFACSLAIISPEGCACGLLWNSRATSSSYLQHMGMKWPKSVSMYWLTCFYVGSLYWILDINVRYKDVVSKHLNIVNMLECKMWVKRSFAAPREIQDGTTTVIFQSQI